MINLIKTDFKKLFSLKSFYICSGLIVVFSILMMIIVNMSADLAISMYENAADDVKAGKTLDSSTEVIYNSVETEKANYAAKGEEFDIKEYFSIKGVSELPPGKSYQVYIIMICVVISLFVSTEFSQGTMKNVVSRGFSRTSIYFSKVIVSMALSLIYLIFNKIVNVTLVSIIYGFGETTATAFEIFKVIGVEILLIFAFTSLFVMIAMVTRSTAGAMALNIISCTTVGSLLILGNMAFKDIKLENYYLEGGISNIMSLHPSEESLRNGVIMAAIYLISTSIIGLISFKKADIK